MLNLSPGTKELSSFWWRCLPRFLIKKKKIGNWKRGVWKLCKYCLQYLTFLMFYLGIWNIPSVQQESVLIFCIVYIYMHMQRHNICDSLRWFLYYDCCSHNAKSFLNHLHFLPFLFLLQIIIGGKNKYLINGVNASNSRVQDLFSSVGLNVNNPHFLIMQVLCASL